MGDAEIQAQFRPDLFPGERLLWAGRPRGGIILRSSDILLIPFSLFWCGFAIFWESMALTSGAPLDFALFGVPFILIGLYVTIGRFVHDAAIRARLFYGVTDQRVLILRAGLAGRRHSLDLANLPMLELEERPDGRGTIRFDDPDMASSFFARGQWHLWVPSLGGSRRFEGIAEARRVYDLIYRAGESRSARR
jgi:hypothetical protein